MRACMAFDLSLAAERYRRVNRLDARTAALHEREFRRFFGLMAASAVPLGLRSKAVDKFWHELITCTALYREWCQAVAGRFIDHDPNGGGDAPYARTWAAYAAAYGQEPPASIWPRPVELPAAKAEAARTKGRDDRSSSSGGDVGTSPLPLGGGTEGGSQSGSGDSGSDGGSSCGGGCGGGG